MDIVYIAQTTISFIVAISILVTVHEYGHFYAARKLGFKVEKLSIGFGRALLSWKSRDGEVEYVIAWIPLGGYVKMLGESSGESLSEHDQDDAKESDKFRSYELMPIWKRATVAFAGPFFNLAFAVILYMFIGWIGNSVAIPVIGNVAENSPASISGIESGDRIIRINKKDVNSWQSLEEAVRPNVGKEISISYLHGDKIISSNLKLGLTKKDPMLSNSAFEALGVSQRASFVISSITSNSASEKAGVEKGKIVSLNGVFPSSSSSLISEIHKNKGKEVELKVLTEDKIIKTFNVKVDKEKAVIGIVFDFKSEAPREHVSLGFIDGFEYGFVRTWEMTVMITQGIGKLMTGSISSEYISGPITIAQISERSMESGFVSFLIFLAVISLNLGIMNLLPIPILDGGHLIFLGIEKIKKSAIEPVVLEKIQYTGLVLILGLMFFAIYNDLVRIIA